MNKLNSMPIEGSIVIVIILALFVLALILLFYVCARYKRLSNLVADGAQNSSKFLHFLVADYADAYKLHGKEVNTPAIITDSIGTGLKGLLLCERFLNNAVSLFVTLGLFGTFMGLSLSVSSLTELLGSTGSSEWLSILNSVGSGLMSALSGMGVAFYTSLVGVACSILLTILRAIFNPETARQQLEVQMELWLDHSIAPKLKTNAGTSSNPEINAVIEALNNAADNMDRTLQEASANLNRTLDQSRAYLGAFNQTVGTFNDGVHDFSEFNYNLRGTVERMDLSMRDVVAAMRETARSMERSGDR